MTARAKRQAKSAVRWRGQVARLIAESGACAVGEMASVDWCARVIERGQAFDVHAAREYGERLVALEAEQVVFEDWCRARGCGPERKPCEACDGRGFWEFDDGINWGEYSCCRCETHPDVFGTGIDPWPGLLAREYARRGLGPASAANGRSLARLGRRLLAALEGQPSECRGVCDGGVVDRGYHAGRYDDLETCEAEAQTLARLVDRDPAMFRPWLHSDGMWRIREYAKCPDCRGTGHNLSGVLPAVEWSALALRKGQDAEAHRTRRTSRLIADRDGNDWVDEIPHGAGYACEGAPWTRVAPRGEHRVAPSSLLNRTVWRRAATEGEWLDADEHVRAWRHANTLPRRTFGEFRHAEQRRERARRPTVGIVVDAEDARRFADAHGISPDEAASMLERAIADRTPPGATPRDVQVLEDGSVSVGYTLPGRIDRVAVTAEFVLDESPE